SYSIRQPNTGRDEISQDFVASRTLEGSRRACIVRTSGPVGPPGSECRDGMQGPAHVLRGAVGRVVATRFAAGRSSRPWPLPTDGATSQIPQPFRVGTGAGGSPASVG